MISHIIFLSSDYYNGKRIGLHFAVNDNNRAIISELSKQFSEYDNIAFYQINTSRSDLDSVKEKEPFFSDVQFFEGSKQTDVDVFEEKIRGKAITALDTALLILSLTECSYATMIVYLFHIYCLYRKDNKKNLFSDTIKCSKHGLDLYSLDNSIMPFFRQSRSIDFFDKSLMSNEFENSPKAKVNNIYAVFSKLLFSEDGRRIFSSVRNYLEKLLKMPIYYLYERMVEKGSPYYRAVFDNSSNNLKKEDIINYYKRLID